MKGKPKIAIIGLKGLPAFGGAATVGENIIEQLKDKYDFTVYAISSHTDLKTGHYNGYKQIVFKKIPCKKLNSLYYYIFSAIHSLFIKYDLIHLHHRDAAFILPLLKIRSKVILTIHGFGGSNLSSKWDKFKWYFDIQEKYFVRTSNVITTMSLFEKDYIEKQTKKRVIYIPNGINLMVKSYLRSDYILFAAGRIVSFKRCDIFLKALKQINFSGKVVIVGYLNEKNNYSKKLISLAQGLDVSFAGLIKEKAKLLEIFGKARFFVFPSYREAMSMILLEVASVKTPIICSDIPGNQNLFNAEEVLFFKRDNINDLAQKLTWALQNQMQIQKKAIHAYNKIKTNYLWKDIALKYQLLYEDFIS